MKQINRMVRKRSRIFEQEGAFIMAAEG